MIDALAVAHAFQDVVFLRLAFWRNQHSHGLSDQFAGGVAEQAFRGGIARLDDAIEVLRNDRIVGRVDDGREVGLRGDRFFLIRDVAKVADDAKLAIRKSDAIEPPFVERHDAPIEVELGALGCDVRLAGRQGVPENPNDFIGVILPPR